MTCRAAIYCRISDDRDGGALGVKRQEEDCRALAERKGWPVAELFVDNDVSAYSGKARPAYRRMLEAIKHGEIDAVVVWHLDRLHRAPKELEEFFEACDAANIKDLASVTGDVDLSTFDGRFMARILGAVARKESDDKSRRTRRKHVELAQLGTPVGGGRPFGYESDRVTIHPEEAARIREAADRILAGDTLRSICIDWRDDVRSPRGNAFTQTALRRILTSYRIVGKRQHGPDGPIYDGQWPPILDEDTHRRVREIVLHPDRRVAFGARSHLLSGFLICGKCSTRLIARRGRERRRTYICSADPGRGGCNGLRVVAEPLEELIVEALMLRLDTEELAEARAAEPDGPGAGDALRGLEERLDELAGLWAGGEITRREWMTARGDIETRLEAASKALVRDRRATALDEFVGRPGALRAEWADMSLERRRAVLAAIVDRIIVGPAFPGVNRFDPDRVDVIWKV